MQPSSLLTNKASASASACSSTTNPTDTTTSVKKKPAHAFGQTVSYPDETYPFSFQFQPYISSTQLASELSTPYNQTHPRTIKKTTKEIKRLAAMTEHQSQQHFDSLMQFQIDSKGFSHERNYRVVANTDIKENTVLGLYSGESVASFNCSFFNQSLITQKEKIIKFATDELYYQHILMSSFDKELLTKNREKQRQIICYTQSLSCSDPHIEVNHIPKNNILTPMHFINAADNVIDINTLISIYTFKYKGKKVIVPFYESMCDIKKGKEILAPYFFKNEGSQIIPKSDEEKHNFFDTSFNKYRTILKVKNDRHRVMNETFDLNQWIFKRFTNDENALSKLGLYSFTDDIQTTK